MLVALGVPAEKRGVVMLREHAFVARPSRVRPMSGAASQARPGAVSSPVSSTVPSAVRFTQIVVAHVYGVPLEALLAGTRRDRQAAEARQVAMYLAHVVCRMNKPAVARAFGRERTTAHHACRRVEDLREDPDQDRLLAWLEVLLRNAQGERAGEEP